MYRFLRFARRCYASGLYLSVAISVLGGVPALAQSEFDRTWEPSIWPDVPGLTPDDALTLVSMEAFILVAAATWFSFLATQDQPGAQNYLYSRNGITEGDDKFILSAAYGIERRYAPWFALGISGVAHAWHDSTPFLNATPDPQRSVGVGTTINARWYAFGERRLSPYLEYGAGLFYGADPFPDDGTNFTFNLSTHVGVEYELGPNAFLRLGYGNAHQSNNGFLDENPGFDGNGFSLTYAWRN